MLFFMGTWKKRCIWIFLRGTMPEGKLEYAGCESHSMDLSNHLVHGDDMEEMMKLEQNHAAEFEMKNLGDLKYFLGMEVARSSRGIFLSPRKYVLDFLKETCMLGCKHVDTPIVKKHYLGIYPDQEPVDRVRY
ncbi:hypothetical protein ACFX13_035528 [Malus domestica]